MIDELAHAAGKDPVDFRLALLDGAGDNDGGAKKLANALRAGDGPVRLRRERRCPRTSGIGVACVSSQERATATWTACAAQVEVDPADGEFKVKRLTLAMDLGTVVNPDGVRAQIEGSALWGMSLALFEKAPLKNGALQQTNFDGYTPMRMSQMPDLDISVIANNDPASGLRRARRHGDRAGHRQRHLQRGGRPGALAADHGGGREGGDEGLSARRNCQVS